jgi:hypothetical protein
MSVEMSVDSVRIDLMARHRFVVLKENDRERFLPIAIGSAEAGAIAIKLMNAQVMRPLTHDLICTVLSTLGGQVTKVLITNVVDGVFFARIVMDAGGRHVEIDSRPSDAIALAVRLGTPILVEEAVLAQAAVETTDNAGEGRRPADGTPPDDAAGPSEHIPEEQLTLFREVINHLDLDDLGK